MPTLPATVFSGFLGAGKTTLLNHILKSDVETRYAVILNDLSELNFRELSFKPGRTQLKWEGSLFPGKSGRLTGLVELHNGCICCTLRDELIHEVYELARLGAFDHLLIEATGVAEPIPIAMAFDQEAPDGSILQMHAPLESLVTVVDAHNFLKDWEQAPELLELKLGVDDLDNRTLADLLAEQVEFADTIILNKIDLVSADQLADLRQLIHCINPAAHLIETMYGQVAPEELIHSPKERPTREYPARHRNLRTHSELEIGTFIYRARRPFHPGRFWKEMQNEWPNVMRSKGLFWLATRMNDSGIWSQAGSACSHQAGGRWWGAVPRQLWPDDPEAQGAILREFKGPFGDRRQEIVLIGRNLDREELKARLDGCLLSDSEMKMGPLGWRQLPDPFPAWESDLADEIELPHFTLPKEYPSA